MKSGFIYPIVNWVFNSLRFLSIVELFKLVGEKMAGENASGKRLSAFSRTSVDVFIVLKFLFVAFVLFKPISGVWVAAVVWYLLATNLYTYFFYHLWSKKVLSDRCFGVDRIKRRFMTLSLAIFFSVIGFSYLYRVPYMAEYSWGGANHDSFRALLFSVANSFGASYDQVSPVTDVGRVVAIVQFLTMFVFLAIILSNSIPQTGISQEDG